MTASSPSSPSSPPTAPQTNGALNVMNSLKRLMENPPDDATPTPAPAQATDGYTSLVADALAELGLGSDALPPWHFDPTNPPPHVRERVRRLLGTAAYCIPTASVNDGGTATGIVGGVFAIESQRRSHLNGARNAEANARGECRLSGNRQVCFGSRAGA